jgi:hypothetical protein
MRAMFGFTLVAAITACSVSGGTEGPPGDELAIGRWGGPDRGVIVMAERVHIHIGCTKGDVPAPVQLDAQGRFQVDGQYMLRAYPIARENLPAQVSGIVSGRTLTISVAVNDTVLKKVTSLGPVTVTLGVEPQMANCPICATPAHVARPRP